MLVLKLLEWYAKNARDLPWRRTRDPYPIWVSEIMLQQTQVKTVLPYWRQWMRALPSIHALARASSQQIHKLWEGLGYYTRVRNLQKAARLIMTRHGGRFPDSYNDVRALPGIGRYTAGAICSIAFDQPVPALDGNVIRVLTRLYGISENPRENETNTRLWRLAGELVARADRSPRHGRRNCSALNQALMEVGALICLPRRPECGRCPVARECAARRHGMVEKLPNLGPRRPPVRRRFAAFVIESRGRYLVRQRPPGGVNAWLWEFPNVELNGAKTDLRVAARAACGFALPELRRFCAVTHAITRSRIRLEAHAGTVNAPAPPIASSAGRWLRLARLAELPFTGAHRKILRQLIAIDKRPAEFQHRGSPGCGSRNNLHEH